jgi:excisionase family DNA binding protein
MTPSDWTTKDVAAFFGVKPRTVADWAKDHKIPHYLLGGLYRYVPAEIEAWRDAHRVEARV